MTVKQPSAEVGTGQVQPGQESRPILPPPVDRSAAALAPEVPIAVPEAGAADGSVRPPPVPAAGREGIAPLAPARAPGGESGPMSAHVSPPALETPLQDPSPPQPPVPAPEVAVELT